jgi:YD repeat-containing protein
MNRLTGTIYPDGSTVGFGYDYRGRRTSVTDQNNKTTTYTYDDADRLTSVTDPAHNTTQYAYDVEDNLLSITDANNHITSFQYNARLGHADHISCLLLIIKISMRFQLFLPLICWKTVSRTKQWSWDPTSPNLIWWAGLNPGTDTARADHLRFYSGLDPAPVELSCAARRQREYFSRS